MDNLMKNKFYVDNESKETNITVSLNELQNITRSLEANKYIDDSLEKYLEVVKVLNLLNKYK